MTSFLRTLNVDHLRRTILVYQMGKVGSKSIVTALAALNIPSRHVHSLYHPLFHSVYASYPSTNFFLKKKGRTTLLTKPKRFVAARIYETILRSRSFPVRIITLAREPIARNISMYFEGIQVPLLDIATTKAYSDNDNTIHTLLNDFKHRFNHTHGITWFANEFQRSTRINIYAYPFDKEEGYSVIASRSTRILLLKFEKLPSLSSVISDFIGDARFSLVRKNQAAEKWYAPVYKLFKQHLSCNAAYVQNLYTSPYMRHFYSDAEIAAFRRRWRTA